MAKHIVKCIYCNQQFDREAEPTKQVSARRYAHLQCWQDHQANMSQEEKDMEAFYDYAKTLFGEDYNYILTIKLAEQYIKDSSMSLRVKMINYCRSISCGFLLIYVEASMCAYHFTHIKSQGKKELRLVYII
jgi:hypothetical protein